MTDHFIKLSCTTCGGELEIYDDIERFFCGHCGTETEVQRRGGTVVLRVVTDAIRNVQTGTDKTAAQVVLARLKEEAGNLSKQHEAMLNGRVERKKVGYAAGIGLLMTGFLLVRSGISFVLGMVVMMAGILTVSYIRRSDKRVLAEVRELQTKIDVLNGRIEDHAPAHL